MPYEGPFESQEEEDAAYNRSERIRARVKAAEEAAAKKKQEEEEAEEKKTKKKKKSDDLLTVD
jgi:hypothetical protein